jgi:capsular exopolysaccharide synthesis family protein
MSHVFEALKRAEEERNGAELPELAAMGSFSTQVMHDVQGDAAWLEEVKQLEPKPRPENRLVALTDGDSLGAEKFRLLRARLRHLQETNHVRRVIVTSGVPNDGKTMVSANLAASLARHNVQKVLLLEGDLRKPNAATQFGLQGLDGITEWSDGTLPLSHFVYRMGESGAFLLPAGKPSMDALKILNSPRFTEELNQISAAFDWVIIDTPPLFPVADVHFWSKHADGMLLVVRRGNTSTKLLEKGLKSLDNMNVLGVVLNDVPAVESSYYEDYYSRSSKKK